MFVLRKGVEELLRNSLFRQFRIHFEFLSLHYFARNIVPITELMVSVTSEGFVRVSEFTE